ncbi:MAG: ATP synthase subunit B family protein [Armatimonadota bacterium]
MDVNKLLDELEEFVEHGNANANAFGKMRFFRKAFFLDVDDVLDYTHQIRVSLPQQIQKADQITREKERILAEAREQADRMVTEAAEQAELTIRKAQEDARILVSNNEITRLAHQESQRIIEQSRQEAEEVRRGASEYARNTLENLSNAAGSLSQRMTQIQQVAQQLRDEVDASKV